MKNQWEELTVQDQPTNTKRIQTILIADESLYMRTALVQVLTDAGFTVVGAADSGSKTVSQARSLDPDLITIDDGFSDMGSLEILKHLKQEEPLRAEVVLISSNMQESVVEESLTLGAADYILKPFLDQTLIEAILNLAVKKPGT